MGRRRCECRGRVGSSSCKEDDWVPRGREGERSVRGSSADGMMGLDLIRNFADGTGFERGQC